VGLHGAGADEERLHAGEKVSRWRRFMRFERAILLAARFVSAVDSGASQQGDDRTGFTLPTDACREKVTEGSSEEQYSRPLALRAGERTSRSLHCHLTASQQ
jgi:hypothetical protein